MPFGVVNGVGLGMGGLEFGGDRRGGRGSGECGQSRDGCIRWGSYRTRERGSFGVEFGVSHCIMQCMLHVCARVTRSFQITLRRTCSNNGDDGDTAD